MATLQLVSAIVIILYIGSIVPSSNANDGLDNEEIKSLYAGLSNALDVLKLMRPVSQVEYNRSMYRNFFGIIKIITSFVRQQESFSSSERTSLTSLIRGQIIDDSCSWLQSQLVGYDRDFNCTLEELELLELRIDLVRSLNEGSRALKGSSACASGCGSLHDTSTWLEDVLPCGEATVARNALHHHFGGVLEGKRISIDPCVQSS